MTNKDEEKRKQSAQVCIAIFDRMLPLIRAGSSDGMFDPEAFDKVFKDVFNVKKYGTKMWRARSSRSISNMMAVINEIGLKLVYDFLSNEMMYNVLRDLIAMRAEIDELEYKIKKSEKKQVAPKEKWVDDLTKYEKKYRKTTKQIRKIYGISGDGQFTAIDSFLDASKGYNSFSDFGGWGSMYDDDDFSFGPLFDDYGDRPKKWVGRSQGKGYDPSDFDLIFGISKDDEFDEDEDDDLEEAFDEMDKRMERIENAVNIIAGKYLEDEEDEKRSRKSSKSKSSKPATIDDLGKMMGVLIDKVEDIGERIDTIENDIYEDEEEEENTDNIFASVQTSRPKSQVTPEERDIRDADVLNAFFGGGNNSSGE